MTPVSGESSKKAARRALRKLAEHGNHHDFLLHKVADRHANQRKADFTDNEVEELFNLFESATQEDEVAFSLRILLLMVRT